MTGRSQPESGTGASTRRLRIESARHPLKFVAFEDRAIVGRSAEADVSLDDPFSSRNHFEIKRQGRDYWLTDLGSRNGTIVNGAPVREPIVIVPGDRVRVGDTVIQLETDQAVTTAGVRLTADSMATTTSQLTTVLSSVERATGSACSPDERRDLFKVVSEASVALLAPASLSEALSRTLDLVFEAIPAERAFLYLRFDHESEPTLAAANYRDRETAEGADDVRISRAVKARVLERGHSVLTSDAQVDSRFNARESVILSGVRSILAVPLAIEDRVLGMLYADSPGGTRALTQDDLELATTIASVAAIKVENSLLVEERIETERLREQVAKAQEIQQALLPAAPPALPGYRLDGSSRPCWEVGGDCFDFIPFGFGRLLIVLGDVAGKGLDAALVISSLHAFLRSQAFERVVAEIADPLSAMATIDDDSQAKVDDHSEAGLAGGESNEPFTEGRADDASEEDSPATLELESAAMPEQTGGLADIVERLNHYLVRTTPANRFATLFLGLIDARENRLEYVNAGHNPPMLVSATGEISELTATGMPVGMLPGIRWQLAERSIEPGDVLLAFSDGVTEAVDSKGEELGEMRLGRWLVRHRDSSASELRRRLLEDLDRFVGDRPPLDDVTLLIAQRPIREGRP